MDRGVDAPRGPCIKDYDQLYNEAIEAGRRRDYRAAVELLTEVAGGSDRHPQALLYLGRAYHALGDLPRAVHALEYYLRTAPDSVAGRFFLGRTYLALGLAGRAARLLEAVTEAHPNFAAAESLLGLALLRLRRPDAAVVHFERAARLEPDNERIANGYLNALVIRGVRAAQRSAFAEAERVFRSVLERRPDNLLAHVHLGRIYRERGRPDLSLHHYSRAAELAPDDPVLPLLGALAALKAGRADLAASTLERLTGILGSPLKAAPPGEPEVLLRLAAVAFFQSRRFRDALRAAKLALRVDYHDAEMHMLVAHSYLATGQAARARNHFERAIQYGGSRLEASYGLALALWELHEHQELLRVARRIERLAPGDRSAHYFEVLARSATEEAGPTLVAELQQAIRETGPDEHLMVALGRAYVDTGRPDLAVGWLERALRIARDGSEALCLLLEAHEALGEEKGLHAAYRRYLQRFTDDDDVRRRFVRFLTEHRMWEEATREVLALLPRNPGSRTLRTLLASCYMETGRYRDAAVLYRDLLRDQPRSLPLLRALVRSLDRMRAYRAAISLLEKADPFFKGHTEVLLPLGVLYAKVKDYERALATFRRVLAAEPHNWKAHHNMARIYRKTGQELFAERFFANARRYREQT